MKHGRLLLKRLKHARMSLLLKLERDITLNYL